MTVRLVPQLSVAVTVPQALLRRLQSAASASGAQLHTLAVPPPPQVAGSVHVPQSSTVRLVPQLSIAANEPQSLPSRAQMATSLSGMHGADPPPPADAPAPADPTSPAAPDPAAPTAPPDPTAPPVPGAPPLLEPAA
jgi:hypothetical protein